MVTPEQKDTGEGLYSNPLGPLSSRSLSTIYENSGLSSMCEVINGVIKYSTEFESTQLR